MNPVPPRAVSAVMIMPEEISLDCPVCSSSHVLTRGLDFDEDRSGVWRLTERPGFICDCALALIGDFTLALYSPGSSDTRSPSVAELQDGSFPERRLAVQPRRSTDQ